MELLTVPPLLCYHCSWTATKTNSKSSISPPEHLQWLQMEGRHRDLRRCYRHLANGSGTAARSHYGAGESLCWVEAKTYTLIPRWWFTSAEQQEGGKKHYLLSPLTPFLLQSDKPNPWRCRKTVHLKTEPHLDNGFLTVSPRVNNVWNIPVNSRRIHVFTANEVKCGFLTPRKINQYWRRTHTPTRWAFTLTHAHGSQQTRRTSY